MKIGNNVIVEKLSKKKKKKKKGVNDSVLYKRALSTQVVGNRIDDSISKPGRSCLLFYLVVMAIRKA